MKPIERLGIGRLFFNKGLYQYHDALYIAMDELRRSGLVGSVSFVTRNGDPVDHAREKSIVELFALGLDAMVWIDTDLIIPPDALVRLVRMSNAGYPIAGGLYRRAMHKPEEQIILTKLADVPGWATLDALRERAQGGVTEVALTAGGFTIVRREVYEVLERKIGRPWYACYDAEAGDWPIEDTYFYRRVARAGIPVHVDPELHAVHWSHFGPVPVTPDAPEMAACL